MHLGPDDFQLGESGVGKEGGAFSGKGVGFVNEIRIERIRYYKLGIGRMDLSIDYHTHGTPYLFNSIT